MAEPRCVVGFCDLVLGVGVVWITVGFCDWVWVGMIGFGVGWCRWCAEFGVWVHDLVCGLG